MSDSKELAAMLGSGNLPDFVKNGAGAKINKEATGGVGGESINRISLKQSRFRLIVGGEQVKVVDEPYLDVIIVRSNPNVSKAYYGRDYDPNAEDQSPKCYSSNGVVPDDDAQEIQCSTCAACPHNQWGSKISAVSGKKVKACSDVKRVAIAPHNNPEAPLFQVAIPAASMKVFGNYVRQLNQTTPPIPYNALVTRVKFDPDSDFPKLMFEPVRWLSGKEYDTVNERYDSEEAKSVATIVDTPVNVGNTEAQQSDVGPSEAPDDPWAKEEAAQAAAAKAEEERAAELKRQALEEQAAKKAKAAEAKRKREEEAAAKAAKEEAEAKADRDPEQAARQAAAMDAAAGWGSGSSATPEKEPPPAAAKSNSSEPPTQRGGQQNATVVEDDNADLSSVFGPGWDD